MRSCATVRTLVGVSRRPQPPWVVGCGGVGGVEVGQGVVVGVPALKKQMFKFK